MKLVEVITQIFAKAVDAAPHAKQGAIVAMASVAQTLAQACKSTLAIDIKRLKESMFERIEARTLKDKSEADIKIAEAAEAANKVRTKEHEAYMQEQEQQKAQIENVKRWVEIDIAAAEADKARTDAAAQRLRLLKSMMDLAKDLREERRTAAEQDVLNALAQLLHEGGTFYVNRENLNKIAKLKQKPGNESLDDRKSG